MNHDHKLTYIDLQPKTIKPPRNEWLPEFFGALACLAIFALIGVLLAWRG